MDGGALCMLYFLGGERMVWNAVSCCVRMRVRMPTACCPIQLGLSLSLSTRLLESGLKAQRRRRRRRVRGGSGEALQRTRLLCPALSRLRRVQFFRAGVERGLPHT
jgi:hypothetical protein